MKKTVTTFVSMGDSYNFLASAEHHVPGWPVLELEVECEGNPCVGVSREIYSAKIVKIHGKAVEEVKKYALVYGDLSCSPPKFDTAKAAADSAPYRSPGVMEYTLQDGVPVASRFIPKADIGGEK